MDGGGWGGGQGVKPGVINSRETLAAQQGMLLSCEEMLSFAL